MGVSRSPNKKKQLAKKISTSEDSDRSGMTSTSSSQSSPVAPKKKKKTLAGFLDAAEKRYAKQDRSKGKAHSVVGFPSSSGKNHQTYGSGAQSVIAFPTASSVKKSKKKKSKALSSAECEESPPQRISAKTRSKSVGPGNEKLAEKRAERAARRALRAAGELPLASAKARRSRSSEPSRRRSGAHSPSGPPPTKKTSKKKVVNGSDRSLQSSSKSVKSKKPKKKKSSSTSSEEDEHVVQSPTTLLMKLEKLNGSSRNRSRSRPSKNRSSAASAVSKRSRATTGKMSRRRSIADGMPAFTAAKRVNSMSSTERRHSMEHVKAADIRKQLALDDDDISLEDTCMRSSSSHGPSRPNNRNLIRQSTERAILSSSQHQPKKKPELGKRRSEFSKLFKSIDTESTDQPDKQTPELVRKMSADAMDGRMVGIETFEEELRKERESLQKEKATLAFEKEGLEIQLQEAHMNNENLTRRLREAERELQSERLSSNGRGALELDDLRQESEELREQLKRERREHENMVYKKEVEIESLTGQVANAAAAAVSTATATDGEGSVAATSVAEKSTHSVDSGAQEKLQAELAKEQLHSSKLATTIQELETRIVSMSRDIIQMRDEADHLAAGPARLDSGDLSARYAELEERMRTKDDTIEFLMEQMGTLKKTNEMDASGHGPKRWLDNLDISGHMTRSNSVRPVHPNSPGAGKPPVPAGGGLLSRAGRSIFGSNQNLSSMTKPPQLS